MADLSGDPTHSGGRVVGRRRKLVLFSTTLALAGTVAVGGLNYRVLYTRYCQFLLENSPSAPGEFARQPEGSRRRRELETWLAGPGARMMFERLRIGLELTPKSRLYSLEILEVGSGLRAGATTIDRGVSLRTRPIPPELEGPARALLRVPEEAAIPGFDLEVNPPDRILIFRVESFLDREIEWPDPGGSR